MNKKVMQSYILIIYTKYHSQNTQLNRSIITIRAYWQDTNNGFSSRLIIDQDCSFSSSHIIAVGKKTKTKAKIKHKTNKPSTKKLKWKTKQ